jgi:hypothetical protein
MAKFIFGAQTHGGPSSVRGAGTDVAGGWSSRRESGRHNPDGSTPARHGAVTKSKKAYTGTLAGIGRATNSAHGTVIRQGPAGPAGYRFEARRLPNRQGVRSDVDLTFRPAARPSLMTRIGRKLGFGRTGS